MLPDHALDRAAGRGAGASWVPAAVACVLAAALAAAVEPERLFPIIGAAFLAWLVLTRPAWGVALMLFMFLVQYGERLTPSQRAPFGAVIPRGVGLLTINNLMGLLLAVLMAYRLYREGDWSFLRSRQVLFIFAATLLLVVASLLNPIDADLREALNLPAESYNPRRFIVSRALFLVLFVFFVREPRELRLMFGIFLGLAIGTAFRGLGAVLAGGGYAGYRAGGLIGLIGGAGNPNRLALNCTLSIILVWEFVQTQWRRWRPLAIATIVVLVLTVFLSASRGGVLSLLATAGFLVSRRRERAQRVVQGLLIAVVGLVLLSQVLPPQTVERLTNIPGLAEGPAREGGGSIQRRAHTLRIALEIVSEHPVLGVGVGNWEVERFARDPARSIAVPHNSYLLAAAEGGLFTLGAYLALFWVTIRRLGQMAADHDLMEVAREDGLDWLIEALRIGILSFCVFSLFADLWESIIFYLLMGASAVLIRRYVDPGYAYVEG